MISFDAATHTYTFTDGVKAPVVFPSVTQILDATGISGDKKFYDDYSRDRGSKVHDTIRLYHSGRLDPVQVDPVIEPYLDAWVEFIQDSKFVPSMLEKILHDPVIRVAGKADVIGTYEDHAAILDIKTGQPHPATAIQLAGYEYLYWAEPDHDGKPARRIAVHLQADGKYRLKEYTDRHDRAVWLGAVSVFNWRIANLKGG